MRYLVFLLLGPPLGSLSLVLIALGILNAVAGGGDVPGTGRFELWLALLPAAYILGFIPALLTAVFDGLLAIRVQSWWRVLITGAFGYGVSFIIIAAALLGGFMHGPWPLLFGVAGLIPGVTCSAIVIKFENRGSKGSTSSL